MSLLIYAKKRRFGDLARHVDADEVEAFVIGQWGRNRYFGVLLTPLSNHPLSLESGERVLGYEGVPWKNIYPTLLDAELPLCLHSVNASTDESNIYDHLQAADLNGHLFDTIDVMN